MRKVGAEGGGCGHPFFLAFMLGDGSMRPDVAAVETAALHGVDLLLFEGLVGDEACALPARVRAEAASELERAATHNRSLLEELLRVMARLADGGIPALPLKGPVLAWLLWGNLRLRRCRDIDLLVPQDRVADAVCVLKVAGYRIPPPAGGLIREIHLEHESEGFVLDLHWSVVPGEVAFPLDFAELWAHRRTIRWGEALVPVLGPEWLIAITCMYLVKGYPWPELRYLSDLARLIVRFPELDWDRVGVIAARTGTRRICAVGLALVGALPHAAVPAQARKVFIADDAVRLCVKRLERALANKGDHDPQNPIHRLRKILNHPAFRERLVDKLRAYVSFVVLLLRPGREHADQEWTHASLHRLHRLLKATAGLLASALPARPWLAATELCPAPRTSFHPIDDGGVVLLATTRELYGLTPSAAFLWCLLEEGCSVPALVRRFTAASGRAPAQARVEIEATLQRWRGMGLLGSGRGAAHPASEATESDPEAIPPVIPLQRVSVRRRYQLLDTIFEVGFSSAGLFEAVDPLFRHLATERSPTSAVQVVADSNSSVVIIDGLEADHCDDADAVVSMVKGALSAAAVNRQDFALYLHAAMLQRHGSALLLPAPPQSGKTCLSAALAKAGFACCTDEIALLERGTLAARGLSVALTVKNSAWPLLQPLYPELALLPAHRRADGKVIKYLPSPTAGDGLALAAAFRVRWIVFPRYARSGGNELAPLPRVEALRLLMEECLAARLEFTATNAERLVEWIGEVACYALTFDNLASAVELLSSVCDEDQGPAHFMERSNSLRV